MLLRPIPSGPIIVLMASLSSSASRQLAKAIPLIVMTRHLALRCRDQDLYRNNSALCRCRIGEWCRERVVPMLVPMMKLIVVS